MITDSKGAPKYWKPIAQFDLVDGIKGPDPVGINGAHFYRGNDTGLQHSFIDTDVRNGLRYYYAVVSYDQGDPAFGTTGLQPSECTKIISEDFSGNLKFVDINTAVVTPNAPAAGYVPPQITGNLRKVSQGVGTGSINVNILNSGEIVEGTSYRVVFSSTGLLPDYKTSSYDIIRTRGSRTDTIVRRVDASEFGENKFSPPFDGMTVTVVNDTATAVIDSLTGWVVGSSNLSMFVFPDNVTSRGAPWPSDYEIRFYDTPQDTTYFSSPPLYPKIPVKFTITNTTSGKRAKFVIQDNDASNTLSPGDVISILEFVGAETMANWRIAWVVLYSRPSGGGVVEPSPGDRFVIRTTKRFQTGDAFTFGTKASVVDQALASTQLDGISVVPNPYISGARWERRVLNQTGRGERRIDFTNLPAQCTVRIYSLAGALVRTLYKDSPATTGALSWNLVSEDGMDVSYGLYVYHVDAPGVGQHIGKFAIIK